MTRAERIARIHRGLDELKSRLQRVEGEIFNGKRNVDELAAELQALERPEPDAEATERLAGGG